MSDPSTTLHLYTRVSTVQQSEENYSLDSQKELGILRAEQLGMSYKVWNEGGKSSSSDDLDNRPVLLELLSEVEEDQVKHLFVFNTDRLSRNETSWMMIKVQLLKYGVKLYTSSGEYDLNDPMSSMMLTFMGAISNYDNNMRTERFRIGKIQNLKRNNTWKGGPPPYGYSIKDKHLVPNEHEVTWLNTIYTMYKDGHSIPSIQQHLMNNGVLTRRGNAVWSERSVSLLLEHPHYLGSYPFTDKKTNETFDVLCAPLLDEELVHEVREIKEKRKYITGTRTTTKNKEQLLTGLLRCSSCDALMGAKVSQTNKSQRPYYYCLHKYQKNKTQKNISKTCNNKKNVPIEYLNNFIMDRVVETLSNSSTFKEVVKNNVFDSANKLTPSEVASIKRKMKRLQKEITNINESITSLTATALSSDVDVDAVITKLIENKNDKEKEHKENNKIIKQHESKKEWIDWVGEFKDKLDNLLDDETKLEDKRKFLLSVIDNVSVTTLDKITHEVKITFKISCVNDELVWKNPSKKSLGYSIKEGSNVLIEPLLHQKTNIK